jgi:ribosomal protein L37E
MRDFRSLDHKVECAKCGRKLPAYELENGFCLLCRRLEKEREKEYALFRKQIEKEDKLLLERIKETNDSLKSIPCAFCGRFSISYLAHYDRKQKIISYSDYSYWADHNREPQITSQIAEDYVCSYWRCKAAGNSLSDMHQNIGIFVRMLNKIFPLKRPSNC